MGHACGKQTDWPCCSSVSLSSAGLIMIAASGDVVTVILNEEQHRRKRVGRSRLYETSSSRFMSLLQAAEETDEDEIILRDPEECS